MRTHPVIGCAEAARWEETLLAGDAARTWDAMLRAGGGVASGILRDLSELRAHDADSPLRLLVLCGTGHNAGDALIATRSILTARPRATADVVLVYGQKLRPLARRALDSLGELGGRVNVKEWSEGGAGCLAGQPYDVCIEGIVGLGMRLPLREPAGEVLHAVRELDIGLRAAVDMPAGLGEASADDVFAANFCYATGMAKLPLLHPRNTPFTGRVRLVDIGFFDASAPAGEGGREMLLEKSLRRLGALRPCATDKRSYGHAFLLGGSRTMPGAIAMATMSAVRGGAGLVTTMLPANLSTRLAPLAPEAMWLPLPIDAEGSLQVEETIRTTRRAIERATALLMGPGMDPTRENRQLFARLTRDIPLPLVIDAAAICPEVLQSVAARPAGAAPVVFTPHMGEFARLAGEVEDLDRLEDQLMDFAARYRAVVILKGPVTRICFGRRLVYSPFGGPVLARGGTGDILAGLVTALAARPGADVFESACQAVLWHGLAGEHLARERGQQGVKTTELTDHLSPALRDVMCG